MISGGDEEIKGGWDKKKQLINKIERFILLCRSFQGRKEGRMKEKKKRLERKKIKAVKRKHEGEEKTTKDRKTKVVIEATPTWHDTVVRTGRHIQEDLLSVFTHSELMTSERLCVCCVTE